MHVLNLKNSLGIIMCMQIKCVVQIVIVTGYSRPLQVMKAMETLTEFHLEYLSFQPFHLQIFHRGAAFGGEGTASSPFLIAGFVC